MARRLVAGALICVLAPSVACSRSGFLDDGLQAGGSAPAVTLSTPGLTASREVELSIVCRSPDGSMLVTQSTARPAANDPRWVACAGTAGHTLSGADGLYTIAVWGRDAGGAISDAPGTTQVTLDTTPPNLRWVRAPPAFVAGAAPFSLTWSTTEPHVAPLASFAVEVSVDGGASWSLLTPVQASATAMNDHVSGTDWQVPATDASQALVRVSLSDAVGNTAAPVVSTPFGIDGQPPVLEDFLLAGGAASTASAEVTVAINASDASPMEARLSASPVFTDAGWLPLTSLTSTQLPGANGPKAVYLWIRDAVGHVTPMTARAITLAVSEAWTTIGFVERDGIVASTSGAQTLTLRLAATRLQDVHVTLEVLGDAVYGLDHDLENGREITIPAGQVTAPVTFDVFDARPGTTWWARMEVRAIAVDSPRVRIDDTATTRLGIRSSGAPLTVSRHAMNFEATNGCAVLSDGTLVCWGINDVGQVGDGTTIDRPQPVVIDGGVPYSDVSVGEGHACGVTQGSVLKCWGSNAGGQLGDGSGQQRASPVPIDLGTSYQRAAVGRYHSCALTTGGTVKCWGGDSFAQLGNAASASAPLPLTIDSGVSYRDLRTFMHTTCGITTANALRCWGWNSNGQVGNNSTTDQQTPVTIDSGTTYQMVSPGTMRTCGVTSTGVARCWGYNSSGQLGDGSTTQKLTPVTADTGTSYADIHAGLLFSTCGVTTGAELRCFASQPIPQQGGRTWTTLSGSERALCGSDAAGAVGCFLAGYGPASLGDGVLTYRRAPAVIDDARVYDQLSLGPHTRHGCVLSSGQPYCWGGWPALAASWGSGYTAFALGEQVTCGVAAGQLTCAGSGPFAPLEPHVISSASRYVAVAVGNGHACAITDLAGLECMGTNASGQVGSGGTATVSAPLAIDVGTTYAQVSAACTHTCAVTTNGVLKCWGANDYGQLGNGTTSVTPTTTPTVVDSGVAYSHVGVGCDAWSAHTCAVVVGGQLKCWGSNGVGQLGDGTTTPRPQPTPIDSAAQYAAVALTRFNNGGIASIGSCGLTTSGLVRCWGGGGQGQIGNGGFASAQAPQAVDSGTTYSAIARGKRSACGLTTQGVLKCWGDDTGGELGDAGFASSGAILELTPWLTK